MNRYIISSAQGGLANRVKCLINSIILSEKFNLKIKLYWPKTPSCNCNFSDLFNLEVEEISKDELRYLILNESFEYISNSTDKIKNKDNFILLNTSEILTFWKKGLKFLSPSLSSEKINYTIRNKISKIFEMLEVKKEFLVKAEKFAINNFHKNTLGIHIRRGDFKMLKWGFGSISPSKIFERVISLELQEQPSKGVFLSTDSLEEEINFKKNFPKKIITFPKKIKSRGGEGAVKEALIELLLLSKTDKLYGTYGSTFNELASWINPRTKREVVFDKKALKKYLNKKSNIFGLIFNNTKGVFYKILIPFHKRFLDRI